MKRLVAHKFESDLSLSDMLDRLNTAGPWRWEMRDSERWGDYIATRALPEPDHAIVKLVVESGYFVVNVKFKSQRADAQSTFEELQQTLLTRVLISIGARDVEPTETLD